ncbi:MAG TPA: PEP-CTERM sorting domain-containing protein [Telluria sp.]|nr:PEP-CTERM sorting domain-containing protein [Telluria sp.]
MTRIARPAGLALLLGCSLPALADTILIDFDAVTSNARVNQFYNGGTDSAGAAGTDLGVEFFNLVTANALAAPSQPRYVYNATGQALINVDAGFSAFAFAYGTMAPATLSVFSGLNGTGALLGSQTVNGAASAFGLASVAFSGVGRSVMLASLPSYAGLDDLRFTMASPVPEPAGWAMLLAGVGALGALKRRREPLFK